uniref:Uncharacterized protein n=1 Tax=Arundo donax TaxID=35708 RepID=A0A0A8ZIK3_ARUDO
MVKYCLLCRSSVFDRTAQIEANASVYYTAFLVL